MIQMRNQAAKEYKYEQMRMKSTMDERGLKEVLMKGSKGIPISTSSNFHTNQIQYKDFPNIISEGHI